MKKIIFFLCLTLATPALAQEAAPEKASTKTQKAAQKKEKATSLKSNTIEAISPKQIVMNGFADTVEDLLPAVVNISAIQEVQSNGNGAIDQALLGELPKSPLLDDFRSQLENQFRGQQAQKKKVSSIGSGFIISKDGFIVTNSHVIEDADEISVNLNDGTKYKAKIIGIDKRSDLALLKINSDRDLKFVKFGDSDKSRIGDWVIIIGNPYGLGGSVTIGIVSARSRDINNGQSDDFIQTDAAINKGNSGGPMFNLKGEVIGISTAIFSPSGGNIGIGFARPSSSAAQVIQQLKEQGEVTRGWLGVSVQDISDEIAESMKMEKAKGAFVNEVVKDGPADKAGILPTDVIIKFDDQEITEMKILPKTVSKYPVGKTAKITVLRRGKVKVFNVKVVKMKDDEAKKSEIKTLDKKQNIKPSAQILGMGLAELNFKVRKDKNIAGAVDGLLVVEVALKSEAAERGIAPGDIILSANQTPISSTAALKEIIEDTAKSTKKLFLFIKRGESNYGIVLTIK